MSEKSKMKSESNEPAKDKGRKIEKQGYEYLKNNKPKEAEDSFLTALALMEKSGDKVGEAYILGNLGNLCFQSKRVDLAEDYYQRSLKLMEANRDIRGVESSQGNLGNIAFYKGEYDEAQKKYLAALKIVEEHKFIHGQATYSENLGNVAMQKQDLSVAERYFNKAKELLTQEKEEYEKIKVLEEKLESLKKHPAYLREKEKVILQEIEKIDPKSARKELLKKYQEWEDVCFQGSWWNKLIDINKKTIVLLEEMDDKRSMGICYANLAGTLLQQGLEGNPELLEPAEENFLKALEIFKSQQDKKRTSYLLGSLGNIYLHKKDFEKALENFDQSLSIMREMGDALGEARGCSNLGRVLALQKKWESAEDHYRKSLVIMENLQNRPGIAQQNEFLGDVYFAREDIDKSEECFDKALRLYQELKDPQSIREVQNKMVLVIGHPKKVSQSKAILTAELKKPEIKNDDKKKAGVLGELGNLHFLANELDEAQNSL
ncbi:MAG: tetratricopeptide repeat protein, partial [Nitrospinae bacterium]|nr:tetratricopeptide repeat protein [Nitrospinota bacterium]